MGGCVTQNHRMTPRNLQGGACRGINPRLCTPLPPIREPRSQNAASVWATLGFDQSAKVASTAFVWEGRQSQRSAGIYREGRRKPRKERESWQVWNRAAWSEARRYQA